jgi:predicted nucleic acid-binding protein
VILVDSSVWISYLRNDNPELSRKVDSLLFEQKTACISGVILQEVLQGVREDGAYILLRERFGFLPFYESDKSTFVLAADIYRALRKAGKTLPSTDALIAATAFQHGLSILTLDEFHFKLITEHYKKLELV